MAMDGEVKGMLGVEGWGEIERGRREHLYSTHLRRKALTPNALHRNTHTQPSKFTTKPSITVQAKTNATVQACVRCGPGLSEYYYRGLLITLTRAEQPCWWVRLDLEYCGRRLAESRVTGRMTE